MLRRDRPHSIYPHQREQDIVQIHLQAEPAENKLFKKKNVFLEMERLIRFWRCLFWDTDTYSIQLYTVTLCIH